jgi:ABC-2 type transport system permease protein
VAAREIRYTWREPRRRVAVVSGMLLPFIILAGVISRGGLHRHGIVYACLLVTLGVGNRSLNQFGLDGAPYWSHVLADGQLRADLVGKNLGLAITTLPVVMFTAVLLAAVSGGWVELPIALLLALGAIGVQLGVGNVASIAAPVAVPDTSGNLWATSSGQGCMTGVLSLVALGVEAMLALPPGLAFVFTSSSTIRLLEATVGVVYGAGIWFGGLSLGYRLGRDRGPELLAAVSPRKAA